jgi:hypothetical protein
MKYFSGGELDIVKPLIQPLIVAKDLTAVCLADEMCNPDCLPHQALKTLARNERVIPCNV